MTADDVRTIRTTLELTQSEFGMLVEVDAETVERWERGTLQPTTAQRDYLAMIWKMAGAEFELAAQ